MGLIDDITANHRMRSVFIVGILACAVTLAGFSLFHRVAQDDGLVGSGQTIESVLLEQKETLSDLRSRIEDSTKAIEDGRRLNEEADAVGREAAAATQEVESRMQALAGVQGEVRKREAALKAYQQSYREQTWQAAIGEKIPHLVLKSGRHYEDASIVKVTPEGLDISFADGRARISPSELDAGWQHRFDWPVVP